MDAKLLLGLDELRERSGYYIMISPASGALGREGDEEKSWHVPRGLTGTIHAADIMPYKMVDGVKTGLSKPELKRFYELARSFNVFSGIGAYPDWKPFAGLHLDTRTDRMPESPALWSGIKTAQGQKYFEIGRAFV